MYSVQWVYLSQAQIRMCTSNTGHFLPAKFLSGSKAEGKMERQKKKRREREQRELKEEKKGPIQTLHQAKGFLYRISFRSYSALKTEKPGVVERTLRQDLRQR